MSAFEIKGAAGNQKVFLKIANLDKLTDDGVRRAFYKIGNDLKKDVKAEIMKKPKHGRLYRVALNGRIVSHRASAPGEAPANFTGALKSAIDFDVVGRNLLKFGVKSSNTRGGTSQRVEYGRELELGSGSVSLGGRGGNIQPRPYLLPAIKKNENKILMHFEEQIKESIQEKK